MSFDVDTYDFGKKTVEIRGQYLEGFCFDYWNVTRDGNGVNVAFYIGETQHEVTIKFSDDVNKEVINVADYM